MQSILIVVALVVSVLTLLFYSVIILFWYWVGVFSPLFAGVTLLYGLVCLLVYSRTKNRLMLDHVAFALGYLLLLALVFCVQVKFLPEFLPYTPVRSVALLTAMILPVWAPVLIAIGGGVRGESFSRKLVSLALILISVCVLFGPLARPQRRLFILPAGYGGEVRIQLDDPSCPSPPYRSGDWVFVIPPSGELCAYFPDWQLGEETWIFADKPTKTYAPNGTASPVQDERAEPDPTTPNRVIDTYKVTPPK